MKRLFAASLLVLSAQAFAFVTRIQIERSETAFEGQEFGKAGAYQKIVGKFWAELDPTNPRNAGIVDLDKAPRNSQGKVEYSADFYILTPKNAKKGNGTLLYEIGNRGNQGLIWMLNFGPTPDANNPHTNDPTTVAEVGDGFLMRHGYTLVWSGVYGDVKKNSAPNVLTIQLPIAKNADGSSIVETIWDECNYSQEKEGKAQCTFFYPVPKMDKSEATLFVRTKRAQAPLEIPRNKWEFANATTIQLTGGGLFKSGPIYQFIHKAANPPVMGIGLAAIRDVVSYFKDNRGDNPLSGSIRTTLLMGWSQSGRMTREFLYRGFNQDEKQPSKKVFDGAMPFGAGVRPFVNFRFGQPGRAGDKQHGTLYYPDASFPFAYETQTDPLTGKTDGILRSCQESKTCPKVFHLATSNEYWHYKNSQVTTDTLGTKDSFLPDNVRAYTFAGLAHSPYAVSSAVTEQAHNDIRYTYLLRAIVTKMNNWVSRNEAPPPSRVARVSNDTLVSVQKLRWPRIPGVTFAGPVLTEHPIFDYGSEFKAGIIRQVLPKELSKRYPPLVPQVDKDGNDVAGIRHPAVSVPLATRTGWSIIAIPPAKGEMASQDGSAIPFARTEQQRVANKDPRLSVEERYKDIEEYKKLVSKEAQKLVQEGYLLAEDRELIIKQTLDIWSDLFKKTSR
jgi:hypothetical protein